MRKIKVLLASLSLLLFLVSCSRSGSEYIGKWQTIQGEKCQIEIARDGESLLKGLGGNAQKMPAILKDGILQVPGNGATVTYVKDTDKIPDPGSICGKCRIQPCKVAVFRAS